MAVYSACSLIKTSSPTRPPPRATSAALGVESRSSCPITIRDPRANDTLKRICAKIAEAVGLYGWTASPPSEVLMGGE